MPKTSAGIVLFRRRPPGVEVLLVHPGGPFWTKKDEGTWSIPKGEVGPGEDLLAAAKREFREETGAVAEGAFLDLGTVCIGFEVTPPSLIFRVSHRFVLSRGR